MKRRLLHQIAEDYQVLLPSAGEWMRKGAEYMRRRGEWVQILGFNASRFDDRYVPRCSLQFLWIAGPASGSFLSQELKTERSAQRWISMKEHADRRDAVLAAMIQQFKPRIDHPLDDRDVIPLLQQDAESYWPHAYALAVVAARAGDREAAMRHLQMVRSRAEVTGNVHIRQRETELEALLTLGDPQEVQLRLEAAESAMLESLHLS
jgi:hypothetical protein